MPPSSGPRPHVVVLGGGFGGLAAADRLRRADVDVTIVDRDGLHVFQPLLYQVATGRLDAGLVASGLGDRVPPAGAYGPRPASPSNSTLGRSSSPPVRR